MPFWALVPYMAQLGSNLAPTCPPKSLQIKSQDDVQTQLHEKLIFASLQYEMLVFASPRGSKNGKKCIQEQLGILLPFQLKKNTLPASILLQLGSLLGLPRRPQEASKAS